MSPRWTLTVEKDNGIVESIAATRNGDYGHARGSSAPSAYGGSAPPCRIAKASERPTTIETPGASGVGSSASSSRR